MNPRRDTREPDAGMLMSRRDAGHVQDSVRDAHQYLAKDANRDVFSKLNLSKPTAKGVIEHGRRSVGIGFGALGAGYLQGRTNTVRLFGTPVPTGVAVALGAWLVGALGENYLGGLSEDFFNVGDGALASWTTILGLGWGQQARLDAGETTGPIIAGRAPSAALPAPSYDNIVRPLTEAEVYAMRFAHRQARAA